MGPTTRSTVRRLAELARYEQEQITSILDVGLVAHVGISYQGAPVVIPMAYARAGDTVYVHGSTASRVMRALKTGDAICITVTVIDGIVLARSAFNMSMNYRAVVVHGHARLVTDADERMTAFRAIMDHFVPGHWDDVRPPNDQELRQTLVTAVKLDEASAKVSSGPPDDDADDLDLPVWAGQIPLRMVAGTPIPDALVPDDVGVPVSVSVYAARPRRDGARGVSEVVHSTGRGRVVGLVAIAACVVALVVVGGRWFWLRHERQQQEQTVARLTRKVSAGLALLHQVQATRGTADQSNGTVTGERDRVRGVAAALHTSLSGTRANTTATQVGAFVTATQANDLRACLTGVSQALNQLSVGDNLALGSLAAVDQPCRAAGIQ